MEEEEEGAGAGAGVGAGAGAGLFISTFSGMVSFITRYISFSLIRSFVNRGFGAAGVRPPRSLSGNIKEVSQRTEREREREEERRERVCVKRR